MVHLKTIVAMRTFYENLQDPRLQHAIALQKLASAQGYRCVIVDNSYRLDVACVLANDANTVYLRQEAEDMGSATMQAISAAVDLTNRDPDGIVLLTEPEKYDIINWIPTLAAPIMGGNARITMPVRSERSWRTYPVFQRETEVQANNVFRTETGYGWDPMFGPAMFHVHEAHWFTNYNSQALDIPIPCQNRYDVHHCPPAIAARHGVRVVPVEIDFQYPHKQKEHEEADPQMRKKRDQQLVELAAVYRSLGRYLKQ